MPTEPTFEELHEAFGGPSSEELSAAFEPKEESALESTKKNVLGFMTGVGKGALFGQDIPAALATASSYTPFHPKYVPTEGTAGERFEAAKRAQIEAADIAAKEAPKSSAAGTITGMVGSLPAFEVEAPIAGAVEAGTAARLARVGALGPKAQKAVDIAAKGAGLSAAGATTGALYGISEGVTPEERLENAISGAKTGAAFNVVAPTLVAGAKKAVGLTPLSKLEQAGVDVGAPIPASVTSKHPITKFLSEALNVHPITKSLMTEGTEEAIKNLSEARMKTAGLTPGVEVSQAGKSVRDSLVNWVDNESRDEVNKLYDKFERMINPVKKTKMANTEKLLSEIGREKVGMGHTTGVGDPILSTDLTELSKAIEKNPNGLNYDSIQNWKRRIGRKTSQVITSSDVDKDELNRLYGALRKDVELAAKNAGGEKARQAYVNANNEAAKVIAQRKNFEQLISKQGDKVENRVFEGLRNAALEGGKGNEDLLKKARQHIAPDAWHQFASKVGENLGMKNDVFIPSQYIKNYTALSNAGKDTLFGPVGNPTRKAMEDTLTVARGYADAKKDQHYSKLALAGLSVIGLGVPFIQSGGDLSASAIGAGLLGVGGVVPIAYVLRMPRLAHAFNRYMQNPTPQSRSVFRDMLKTSLIRSQAKQGQSMAQEDREQRASGGKLGNRDYPAKRLTRLERAARKAQQEIALETKPIMNQPDAMVAKALEIANGVNSE